MIKDPLCESYAEQIRGFDLDDDAQLLEHFDCRREGNLSGEDWLLYGVLLMRAGRFADALTALRRAERADCDKALYLTAHVLGALGRGEEGLALLDRLDASASGGASASPASASAASDGAARDGAASDGGGDAGWRLHGRGNLLRALGRTEEALECYQRGLVDDPHGAERWWQAAQLLLELGRDGEALPALERALDEGDGLRDASMAWYERAALRAARGDAEEAEQALRNAGGDDFNVRRAVARRATADARFDPVRGNPALAALLAPPDLSWLDELPAWFQAVREDPRLAELGVTWLDAEESRAATAEGVAAAQGEGQFFASPSKSELKRIRKDLAGRVVVGYGPTATDRLNIESPVWWWLHRKRADQLHLALSRDYQPLLWIPAGSSAASAVAALAGYFPRQRLTRVDMPAEYRAFIGYRHEIGDMHDLERHFTFNRFVEHCTWCSGHLDDPWPDSIPQQRTFMLKISGYSRRVASRHDQQRLWSQTWRTVHSRSYFTIEVHQDRLYVVSVRYRPAPHGAVVARFNEETSSCLPPDLPLDVVAAFMGLGWEDAPRLEERLAGTKDPREIAGLLQVLAALWDGDLERMLQLRQWARHPEIGVREQVWNAAIQYNLMFLIEEMLDDPDPELAGLAERVMSMRGAPLCTKHPDAYPDQPGCEPADYETADYETDDYDDEEEDGRDDDDEY